MRTIFCIIALIAFNTCLFSQTNPNWIIKIDDNGNAQVNWQTFRQLIISGSNLKPFTGDDSTDYIGEVYYNTDWKVDGFERSAIKRIKDSSQWYYESFFKIAKDSNMARNIFVSIYNELKKTISYNTGDDFIFGVIAEKPLSQSPMNWLAQWSLYSGYKTLPAGLPKVRIALLLSGSANVFADNQMEYTLKLYIINSNVQYDIFTWDEPK